MAPSRVAAVMLQPGVSVWGIRNVLDHFQIKSGNCREFYRGAQQAHFTYTDVPQNLGAGTYGEIHTGAALACESLALIKELLNAVLQIVTVLRTVKQNHDATTLRRYFFKRMVQRPTTGILPAGAQQVSESIRNVNAH